MVKEFKPHNQRLFEARPELQPKAAPLTNGQDELFGAVKSMKMPPTRRNVLFLSGTSGVSPEELEAIHSGLDKIRKEVKSKISINNFGHFVLGEGDYGCTDWYQSKASINRDRGFGQQVDVYKVRSLLLEEPYRRQIPHLEVMVLDRDLTVHERFKDNNFVYGLNSYPINLLSTRRLTPRIGDKHLIGPSLSIVAAHEFGHNYGLVSRNFNVGQGEYRGMHCNGERGPCLMEQVDVPGCKTIVSLARLLVNRATWLCSDCQEEAAFKKDHLNGHGVLW